MGAISCGRGGRPARAGEGTCSGRGEVFSPDSARATAVRGCQGSGSEPSRPPGGQAPGGAHSAGLPVDQLDGAQSGLTSQ